MSAIEDEIFPRIFFKIESNDPLEDFRISREFYDEVIAELIKIRMPEHQDNKKGSICNIPFRLEIKSGSIEIVLSIFAQAFQELDKMSFVRDISSAVIAAVIVSKARGWFERNKKNIRYAELNAPATLSLRLQNLMGKHGGKRPKSIQIENESPMVEFENGTSRVKEVVETTIYRYQDGKEVEISSRIRYRKSSSDGTNEFDVLQKKRLEILDKIYENERIIQGHDRWEDDGGGGSGEGRERAREEIFQLNQELEAVETKIKTTTEKMKIKSKDPEIKSEVLQRLLNERADLLSKINEEKSFLESHYARSEKDLPHESDLARQESLSAKIEGLRKKLESLDMAIYAIVPSIGLEREKEYDRTG